jgi:threonine/homoserine/homoserine lactone efflux protein
MDLSSLLLFIPCLLRPEHGAGPNNLLSLHNASRYGLRTACCVAGPAAPAFSGMIALAAMGLAVVLHTSEYLFLAIKVLGAAYLFYIAWQLWRAGGRGRGGGDHRAAPGAGAPEFWVAAGNPKAILIFTAFLPQFVSVGSNTPVSEQFPVGCGLFLLLEWAAIAIYSGWAPTCSAGSKPGHGACSTGSALRCWVAGLGLLAARR